MAIAEMSHQELADLAKEGLALARGLEKLRDGGDFTFVKYQSWYSRALKAVELLAPDRYEEFRRYYEPDPKRKELGYGSYVIQDLVIGIAPNEYRYLNFDTVKQASGCLHNQVSLLVGVASRLDSVLSNLQVELKAELDGAEIEGARGLLRVSTRAAGVLAGVVLETHLSKVCLGHAIKFRKKSPTLADFNDALRDAGVYETATWRKITYLADIRNICAHKKEADPTREQAVELIDGTAWAVASIN